MPEASSGGDYPDMHKLPGQYTLGGETPVDPPADEPQDTHFRIYLTGDAAKTLFNAMKAQAVRDVCVDDGTMSKLIDAMQCSVLPDNKTYQCWFAIDIKNPRTAQGWAC